MYMHMCFLRLTLSWRACDESPHSKQAPRPPDKTPPRPRSREWVCRMVLNARGPRHPGRIPRGTGSAEDARVLPGGARLQDDQRLGLGNAAGGPHDQFVVLL